MWVEPGLSGIIRAIFARAVSEAAAVYKKNIMSSASVSVNNRGSLWEDDEIQALIAVWRETGIQGELDGAEEQGGVQARKWQKSYMKWGTG